MTTNKPEVIAYLHINKENPEHRGVSLHYDASCTSTLTNTEPLIRLGDYEALQAECEKLAEALEACLEVEERPKIIELARAALAAHRKQGGEE